jgi:hypothetical protein
MAFILWQVIIYVQYTTQVNKYFLCNATFKWGFSTRTEIVSNGTKTTIVVVGQLPGK